VIYKKEDGQNSISNNFIHSVCEDNQGNLWIGTRNGLNFFEFRKDKFIKLTSDSLVSNHVSGHWINTTYCDHGGVIWVGTRDGGLNKIMIHGDGLIITNYRHLVNMPSSLSNNDVLSIFEDSNERLWIGTADGLNLFDRRTEKCTVFLHNSNDTRTLSSSEIRCIYEDHLGNLWLGTPLGLNRWIENSNQFIRYIQNPDDPYSLSHFVINDINEDPEGNLYIATLGGLDVYDREKDNFLHFIVNDNIKNGLNNEFINSLFCDKTGLVWIGTEKGGVNKFNIYQKQFESYSSNPGSQPSLSNNMVNSIMDEENYLWIGTAGGGLNILDKKKHKITYFMNDPHHTQSIAGDFITSIVRDHENNLWIGTWGMGCDRLLLNNQKIIFVHYQTNPLLSSSLINNFISVIYEDAEGNIWIGTEGGLDLFDPHRNAFKHICNIPDSNVYITEVGCLLRDTQGNLWIGTRNGLFVAANKELEQLKNFGYSKKVFSFTNDPNNPESLSENYVISLYEDRLGQLWVGTYGNGLNRVQYPDNMVSESKFHRYTQEQGLCNNVIYGILEDFQNCLWLSTDYGLSRFNTLDETFKNYFVTDGLQSNQFYWSASAKGIDGYLYFGGINGLNFFHPDQIHNNTNLPNPVITELKIYNNPVKVTDVEKNNKAILSEVISQTKEIKLSYKENTISFEFSALSYDLPEKCQYAYKLEGIDQDWVNVTASRRFANYTKLKGGEYIFYVKAANNDGFWNPEPASVKVIILPPFYLTLWFRLLLVIFIVTGIILYLKLHTRSLRIQKQRLEELVNERTAKVEHQKEELLQQAGILKEINYQLEHRQELIEQQKIHMENQNKEIIAQRDKLIDLNKKVKVANQLKLKFFTNVSHEFKTPLTLILGPLEKLIKNWKGEENTKNVLNLINQNAERLLHLINQLMEFRKIEKGKISLTITEGDIFKFVDSIILGFKDLATQRNIKVKLQGKRMQTRIWFDHEKMENILYNLLSNAFKYTPLSGRIFITIDISTLKPDSINGYNPEQKFLSIQISDNGIGIAKDKLPLIFKRFYRIENTIGYAQGSGIGLALTKELVRAHHGTIGVDSIPGEGSVFTVRIPCSKEAYTQQEISTRQYESSDLERQVNRLKYELKNPFNDQDHKHRKEVLYKNNHQTLLIVEDNIDLREFLYSSFIGEYNVFEAGNGQTAFELATRYNPDIIVSDIIMPEMDGIELCLKLKEHIHTSHIPVILLTAKSALENRIEGFKVGADDYIPKPFSIELLETRIKNLIESRKKLRAIFAESEKPEPAKITTNPVDQRFIEKAIKLIESNIDNSEFSVNNFASMMSVSRTLLHKKLTTLTNQSASDFINTLRLKKSRELIISGEYNISEVAYAVGYNDPKYYSRLFRRHFGISPTEYLKETGIKIN
jgi:signal transduction histidine kinase/ligand-binding sensor domain-containing protein/DNA-binding response OmpR family regulator